MDPTEIPEAFLRQAPIDTIILAGENVDFYSLGTTVVGKHGIEPCTKISVVRVPSQGGYVPWFAVEAGDLPRRLVNAAHVAEIHYAKEEE